MQKLLVGTSPFSWNFVPNWPRWREIADFRSIYFRPRSSNVTEFGTNRKLIYEIYPLFMAELPKFPRLIEIGVEEHDGDVRFWWTRSENMAVSWMGNAPAIIIGNSRSLWTTQWGRYHVPQNAFLVVQMFVTLLFNPPPLWRGRLSTTYDVSLEFIGKRIVDFLLLLIELFFPRHYGWDSTDENRTKISLLLAGGSVSANFWCRRKCPPFIIFARGVRRILLLTDFPQSNVVADLSLIHISEPTRPY